MGKQCLAHPRMNAVGADQDVAAHGLRVAAGAVEEIGGDPALVLGEGPSLQPVWIASLPNRSSTAWWITLCNRPRWIENCGTSWPASMPRTSRQTSWPWRLR